MRSSTDGSPPVGTEPSAAGFIPKELVLAILQVDRPGQPLGRWIGLEQLENPEDEVRVVLGVRLDAGLALAKAAQEGPRSLVPHARADECRRTLRRDDIGGAVLAASLLDPAGPGKRRNHQTVPGCQDLVVEVRTRPLEPRGKHRQPCARHDVFHLRLADAEPIGHILERVRHVQNVLADELLLRIDGGVALISHTEPLLDDAAVRTEELVQLSGGPQIERAFRLVSVIGSGCLGRNTVGILRREEPAVTVRHLAQDVVQRVFGHTQQAVVGERLGPLDIRQDELRLVVQHLLEMRDAPAGVD